MKKSVRAIAVLAGVAVSVVGVYFGAVYIVSGRTPAQMLFGPTPSELKVLAQPVVEALWGYRSEHGEFSRQSTGTRHGCADNVYGPFRYQVGAQGDSFQRCVGEYLRDGFVLCHDGLQWHVES